MTTLMATQTQEQDEIDLAQQAIRDVDAFAELYRRHMTRVYRYHIAHVVRGCLRVRASTTWTRLWPRWREFVRFAAAAPSPHGSWGSHRRRG